jgi:hypothetical protein
MLIFWNAVQDPDTFDDLFIFRCNFSTSQDVWTEHNCIHHQPFPVPSVSQFYCTYCNDFWLFIMLLSNGTGIRLLAWFYYVEKIKRGLWLYSSVSVRVFPAKSQSQSHVTTDCLSVSLMSGSHDQMFDTIWQFLLSLWGALSDKRVGLSIVSQSLHYLVLC